MVVKHGFHFKQGSFHKTIIDSGRGHFAASNIGLNLQRLKNYNDRPFEL